MQNPNFNQTYFQEETDAFELYVTLNGNNLEIILKDYVDWAIYSKEYTEDDYCKEIHKKMDLNDVFNAFSQTKHQSDEENMRINLIKDAELKKYEFATIIQNNNLPCYKIERQGQITTYCSLMDMKMKKQLTYQSRLALHKLRNLTEKQISEIKSKTDKSELSKEMQRQKREREILEKRIFTLEEENRKLREECKSTKQQLIFKIQQIYLEYNQKFLLQNQKIQMIQQQNQKFQLQDQKIQMLQQQNQEQTEKLQLQTQRSLDKIAELEAEFNRVNKQRVKTESEQKPMKTIQDIHSLEQKYSDCFKVNGLKVQYSSSDAWTQYIFNQPINHNRSVKFKIKVTKTRYRDIKIGVVDYALQIDKRYSYESGNAMCYHGANGYKYPSRERQGEGFTQGDVVEVDVNRSTSTVKYIINAVLKATETNNMLNDSSRVFVPFVEMIQANDAVEWLMD